MSSKQLVRAEISVIKTEITNELLKIANKSLIKHKRKRSIWVRKWIGRRNHLGASATLLKELASEDIGAYKNILRMSVENFENLLSMVESRIQRKSTWFRQPISARIKLEITLRYLASGDSLTSLQYLFRVPKNTISAFLPEVLLAIYKVLQSFMKVPSTVEEWNYIQKTFETKWNFPNCCGSIDGKHVTVKRPANTGSRFYNYKGTYSIVLFGVVDADYRFIYVDVGSNGRANDSAIFRNSRFNIALTNNTLNFPNNGVLVGDDAFPLRKNLLKPYSRNHMSLKEKIFNYRLSRARRIVENAFGILASRFRVFEKPISLLPETVDLVILASCSLHNWLRTVTGTAYLPAGSLDVEDHNTGHIIPGSWRETTGKAEQSMSDITSGVGSHNYTQDAGKLRDSYADYFTGVGSVPWQLKMIGAE